MNDRLSSTNDDLLFFFNKLLFIFNKVLLHNKGAWLTNNSTLHTCKAFMSNNNTIMFICKASLFINNNALLIYNASSFTCNDLLHICNTLLHICKMAVFGYLGCFIFVFAGTLLSNRFKSVQFSSNRVKISFEVGFVFTFVLYRKELRTVRADDWSATGIWPA